MTQHAVDILKLEGNLKKTFKAQREDIKKLQDQNLVHIEEIKKLNAENSKLRTQQENLKRKVDDDINQVKSEY